MAQINPNATILINHYIENLPLFSKNICTELRNLIHQTETKVYEDWKWNIPIFSKKTMICGVAAFKNHVSLTFFHGANMSDKHKLFNNNCDAKNTRTIKFTSAKEINQTQLLDYLTEAFQKNETENFSTHKNHEIIIPKLLEIALHKNKLARFNFENMAYTYRKEYVKYITEAKKETTRITRLEKTIKKLEKNLKIHEQFQ